MRRRDLFALTSETIVRELCVPFRTNASFAILFSFAPGQLFPASDSFLKLKESTWFLPNDPPPHYLFPFHLQTKARAAADVTIT